MAAAWSDTKAGLPVKKGSISTACLPKSRRKAEWPYQVICMERLRRHREGRYSSKEWGEAGNPQGGGTPRARMKRSSRRRPHMLTFPFFTAFPGAGGNDQTFDTRWWSPNVSVNFAGSPAIEREVVEDVASYGRQI